MIIVSQVLSRVSQQNHAMCSPCCRTDLFIWGRRKVSSTPAPYHRACKASPWWMRWFLKKIWGRVWHLLRSMCQGQAGCTPRAIPVLWRKPACSALCIFQDEETELCPSQMASWRLALLAWISDVRKGENSSKALSMNKANLWLFWNPLRRRRWEGTAIKVDSLFNLISYDWAGEKLAEHCWNLLNQKSPTLMGKSLSLPGITHMLMRRLYFVSFQ